MLNNFEIDPRGHQHSERALRRSWSGLQRRSACASREHFSPGIHAGFLDCGFGLAEAGGAGSRLVLEVRSHDVPFLLDHGQRIATLVYEPMIERPDMLYGTGLGSNYQGQQLKLSKHFR